MNHIAVDFDGTLVNRGQKIFLEPGDPIKGAVEFLNGLVTEGCKVTVFTARTPDQFHIVRAWLKEHVQHEEKIEITNVKDPSFDVMLDDRAMNFDPHQSVSYMANSSYPDPRVLCSWMPWWKA